ncbi:MAG: hypothetical protein PVI66_09190 [Candidatus Aminicenantes bacterium]
MKKFLFLFGLFFCVILILSAALDETVKTTSRGTVTRVAEEGWTDAVNISTTSAFCNYPAVAADDEGNVHAIWVRYWQGNAQVFYNRGDRSGEWEEPTNLSQGQVRIGEGPWAEIQVDVNGNPNVIYSAVPVDNYEALIKRYRNNQWGPHENVSRTYTGGTAYPNLLIDRRNNDYYVFWQDDQNREHEEQSYWEIMTRHLNGGEGNWIGGGVLPDPNKRAYSNQADIDGNGKVYLVYANRALGNLTRVFFTENPNAKDWNTWTDVRDLSGITGMSFAYPQISVDLEGNCYVVWMDTRDGNIEVYFRKRVNGNWSSLENISDSPAASEDPTVACNKETGEIYVTWEEQNKILLRVYSNGEWGETMNMTDNNSQSLRPHIYVTPGGSVHLVFSDDRTGQWNIYHRSKMGRPPEPPQPPVETNVLTSLDQSTSPNTKINTVKWQENPANEDIPRENYLIYRKQQGQGDNQYTLLATLPLSTFIHQDEGLPTSTKYVYAVTVTDSFEQESELSASAEENFVFPPIDLTLETKINRVLFSKEKINYLNWAHNPLNDPVVSLTYHIYRKLIDEPNSELVEIHTTDANTFFHMDRGLSFAEKYAYSITVKDAEGHESSKKRGTVGEEDE